MLLSLDTHLQSNMGTGIMQGSLPSTAFLSFPLTPGGALLLGSVKGEREGAGGQGKGVRQRPQAQAAAANTSVFPFLQGKSGHLLSPIPVLIIDDPKSALEVWDFISFVLKYYL